MGSGPGGLCWSVASPLTVLLGCRVQPHARGRLCWCCSRVTRQPRAGAGRWAMLSLGFAGKGTSRPFLSGAWSPRASAVSSGFLAIPRPCSWAAPGVLGDTAAISLLPFQPHSCAGPQKSAAKEQVRSTGLGGGGAPAVHVRRRLGTARRPLLGECPGSAAPSHAGVWGVSRQVGALMHSLSQVIFLRGERLPK